MDFGPIQALPLPPSLLGESPFWHPDEGVLWWCDIPGKRLNRFDPARGEHRQWDFDSEPGSVAPLGGSAELVLAMRDGLWRFSPASGQRRLLAPPPYNPVHERFNDGKADPQGRFWVGTIFEPRDPALATLHCFSGGRLQKMAGDITVSNGLAFSPDGQTMLWADTKAHVIYAFDFDATDGALAHQRIFARFDPKPEDGDLTSYGGRPDGAAMDREGHVWVAMFEGARVLRLAPDGSVSAELKLPVRCPTMPCFGGPDLRTLYITTAREKRPTDELAREPLAGCVLQLRVPVAGLPVNFARI